MCIIRSDAPKATRIDQMEPRELAIREIRRLGAAHFLSKQADEAIVRGSTLEEFRGQVFEILLARGSTKPLDAPPAGIGLTEIQARKFSIAKLVASEIDPMARDAAGFERAAVAAAQGGLQDHGIEVRGLTIPYEVVRAQLAPWLDPEFAMRTTTVGGSGGNLVENTVVAGSYISPNYVQPVVVAAGATVLPGLVGNAKIPKMSAGVTAGWVSSENTALGTADPTFAQISLTPHDLGVYTDVSRRLMLQSTPGIDQLVSNDIAKSIAIGVDAGALVGTGASGQPTGLVNTSGIGLQPVGTNGGPMTWALATQNVQNVAASNLLGGSLGWITSAQGRLHLARTVKVASYPEYLADGPGFNSTAGYPIFNSQNVPSNITKGTGTNLTYLIFGDWSQLLIGYFGSGIDLLIDPFTFSSSGAVRIRAMVSCDIGVRFASAFSATLDVNPA